MWCSSQAPVASLKCLSEKPAANLHAGVQDSGCKSVTSTKSIINEDQEGTEDSPWCFLQLPESSRCQSNPLASLPTMSRGLGQCPVVGHAVKVPKTGAWSCVLTAELWGFGGTQWLFNDLHTLYNYWKLCRPPDTSSIHLKHGNVNAQKGGFTGPEENVQLNVPDLPMYLQHLGWLDICTAIFKNCCHLLGASKDPVSQKPYTIWVKNARLILG